MLLDESQWRSNLIGDWSVPLIREETKWRYKLYKNWLKFLDEGLGDGFDVVDDGFDDYEDESDDRSGGQDDYDDRDRDSGRFRERERDDRTDRSDGEGGREGMDPRRPPSPRNNQDRSSSDRPLRREPQTKAERYDDWVKMRVGANGVWTDLAEEQLDITRRQRAERDKKRREDQDFEDYKYENERRR